MPQTPPTPPRRTAWPLVCAVLAVALGLAVALVAPGLLAEIRPGLGGARTEAAASPAATGSTAAGPTSSSAPVSPGAVERALRSGLDGAPGTAAATRTATRHRALRPASTRATVSSGGMPRPGVRAAPGEEVAGVVGAVDSGMSTR